MLASRSFPTTTAGYQQLLGWARGFGAVRRAGVECTGSYGAALTRYLRAAGVEVIEVNQPDKATRRRRGKTDTIDAEAAARAVLSGRATATAKTGDGPVEMVRMFKLAKASAIKSRTQAINQLKAVLVGADPRLREALAGLSNPDLIRRCAELAAGTPRRRRQRRGYTLRLLARRILELTSEIDELNQPDHRARSTPHAPQLLARHGVGPDTRRRAADHRRRQPRTARQRSVLRRTVRRQPGRGVLRQDPAPAPQPRRRPASQLRPVPHRAGPAALGSTDPRLPRRRRPR